MKKRKNVDQDLQTTLFDTQTLDPGRYTAPVTKVYKAPVLGDYHLITSVSHLEQIVRDEFQDCDYRAFDTEFLTFDGHVTAFDPRGKLHGISIARIDHHDEMRAWYIPVGHYSMPQLPIKEVRRILLKPMTALGWAIHGKIDIHILRRFCGILPNITFETQIAASFLWHKSRRLKTLVDTLLGWPSLTYDQACQLPFIGNDHVHEAKKNNPRIPFQDLDPDIVVQYACQDAGATVVLARLFSEHLQGRDAYHRVYLPAIYPLCDMEWNGAYVDLDGFADILRTWSARMREIEDEVTNLAGYPVTFNDNGFRDLFYERMNIPSGRKTTTGMNKMDSQALEEIEHQAKDNDQRTIIQRIRLWKQLQKLVTTYDMRDHCLHTLPDDRNIGVVHPTFSLHTTRTGRASSQDPNFQNIPTRTREGAEIRRRFVVRNDEVMIVGDMSQMEPRVTAWYMSLYGDNVLRESYLQGRDIYLTFMKILVDEDYEDLNRAYKAGDKRVKGLRSIAKVMFLAIAYLSTAQSLAENPSMASLFDEHDDLAVKTAKVQRLIDTIIERLPGLRTYYTRSICQAYTHGYVFTGWNYQRDIPEIKRKRRSEIMSGIRYCVNAPIQGMNANLIFAASVWIRQLLTRYDLDGSIQLIGTVHDELDVRAKQTHLYIAATLVQHCLSNIADLNGIPIAVDIEVGTNWADIIGLEIPENPQKRRIWNNVPQAPDTHQIIEAIRTEQSPYHDMPTHPLPPAPAFDNMLIENALPYLYRLFLVNIPVTSRLLPKQNQNTPCGLVLEAYTGSSTRGGSYTRATIAFKNGYESVVIYDSLAPTVGSYVEITKWYRRGDRIIAKEWVEIPPPYDIFDNAMATGQSIVMNEITIDGKALAALVEHKLNA